MDGSKVGTRTCFDSIALSPLITWEATVEMTRRHSVWTNSFVNLQFILHAMHALYIQSYLAPYTIIASRQRVFQSHINIRSSPNKLKIVLKTGMER